jgi:hypothetical protein
MLAIGVLDLVAVLAVIVVPGCQPVGALVVVPALCPEVDLLEAKEAELEAALRAVEEHQQYVEPDVLATGDRSRLMQVTARRTCSPSSSAPAT